MARTAVKGPVEAGRSGRGRRVALVIALAAGTLTVVAAAPPVAADGNEAPDSPPAFESITAGRVHTCAVVNAGTIKCWGAGFAGQLGSGNEANAGDEPGEMGLGTPVIDLGAGHTATVAAAGDEHNCAILEDGTVKCWGNNQSGALGLGDLLRRGDAPGEMGDALPAVELGTGRTATAVSGGERRACALLDNGTVKCWGENNIGQAGQGDTTNRGDAAGEMGDALPAIDLGTERTAAAISAGSDHTCALLDDGSVKCWGKNDVGQLGLGDTLNRGDSAGDMGEALPAVDLGTGRTATAISAGDDHTCALLDDGSVKCWGKNGSFRLGTGNGTNLGDAPGEMGDALAAVGLGSGRTATAVSAGADFSCALLDNGSVKCWGRNVDGALGLGNTTTPTPAQIGLLPPIDLGTGRTAVAITTGADHACAVLDNDAVKCWGRSSSGTLGRPGGHQGDEPNEMGDLLLPIDLGRRVRLELVPDVSVVAAGDPVVYRFTITNVGLHLITDLNVFDQLETDCEGPVDDLSPDEAVTVDCTYTTTTGDLGTILNRATVAGADIGIVTTAPVPVTVVAPAPAVSVSVSADQTQRFSRQVIDYHVTVTNTGNQMLHNAAVTDPAAPDCTQALGTLAVGAVETSDCTRVTQVADAPTLSNVATVDSDETAPVASTPVDVTVDPDRQVDLAIKKARGTFAGTDVYNTDGTGQTINVGRTRGGRVTFVARVENDGDVASTFDFKRVGAGDPGLVVRYFNAGGTDITARVRAGTYVTASLAPGGRTNITIEVAINNTAGRNRDHPLTVRARSVAPRRQTDTAKAVIFVD